MNEPTSVPLPTTNRSRDLLTVIFAMALPTLVTWVYFVALEDSAPAIQQTAYAIGKTVQFGLPILFVWFFYRRRFKNRSDRPRDFLIGPIFGLLAVALMFGLYFFVIEGTEIGSKLITEVQLKVSTMGLNSVAVFVGTSVFYSLCHSFMEEYYWRWFVFDLWKKLIPVWPAMILSGIGFMAHHVILLAKYLGWESPWTYLASIGIAVGGVFWAWLYQRTGRLRSAWISHLLVDAGIFLLGYFLIREIL